jgi:hypothetical protein
MKGLIADVLKAKGRSYSNKGVTTFVDEITVVGIPGAEIFEADEARRPAFVLEQHVPGCVRLVPLAPWPTDKAGPMFGGCFGSTSDGRFGDAIEKLLGHRFYGAVAIHDRFE